MRTSTLSKVLIVCTANICRSPAAAGLLGSALIQRRIGGVEIRTCGIAVPGEHLPADPEMLKRLDRWLSENEIAQLRHHQASQLHQELAVWGELILAMTEQHRQFCLTNFPFTRGKVHLFGQHQLQGKDIEDPFGGPPALYDEVISQLAQAAERWAEKISRL